MLFLSIVIAFLLGYALLASLWPVGFRSASLPLVAALPAGFSLSSAAYFYWMILSGGNSRWYPAVELVLLAAAVAIWFRRRKIAGEELPLRLDRKASVWAALLAVVAGIHFIIPAKLAAINPWGYWDAWARINLKARFLFGGGAEWTWIFRSSEVPHPDYPLLMSSSVARAWSWMGDAALSAPQAISLIWGVLSLAVLYSVTAALRTHRAAVTATLASLTFIPLLFWSSAQYSDIPLASYMLLACCMMVAAERFPDASDRLWLLAGFFAGSAAWCKNEGVVFLFLAVLWLLISAVRRYPLNRPFRALPCFLAGGVVPGGAVLVLKTLFAGETDILVRSAQSKGPVLSQVFDLQRHHLIFKYLLEVGGTFWAWWPLLLLAVAFVLQHLWYRHKVGNPGPLCCVFAMAAAFYLVFLTTPHDLHWHFHTTIDRLILQLWPLFLFGLAVLFRRGEEPDEC